MVRIHPVEANPDPVLLLREKPYFVAPGRKALVRVQGKDGDQLILDLQVVDQEIEGISYRLALAADLRVPEEDTQVVLAAGTHGKTTAPDRIIVGRSHYTEKGVVTAPDLTVKHPAITSPNLALSTGQFWKKGLGIHNLTGSRNISVQDLPDSWIRSVEARLIDPENFLPSSGIVSLEEFIANKEHPPVKQAAPGWLTNFLARFGIRA